MSVVIAVRASLRRAAVRLRPYVLPLAASAVIGFFCVRAIHRAAGGPAAPLDDAFIHLTFARGLAEGRFFQYVPGEGYSSGATSFLWPILLAPFHLLGLRGERLLWAAWLLGWVAHAALTLEVHRITRRLAGAAAAAGAAAICAVFPAFAWFTYSGMETMGLAWVLMRTARVAGAHCEVERARARPSSRELILLGVLAPLIRPEGALASLIAAVALGVRPPERAHGVPTWRAHVERLSALAPLAGPLVLPLLNLAFTGHSTSATTQVKWAIGNPHYGASQVIQLATTNAHTLVTNILDGGDWSWIFLPDRSAIPILLGLVALPIAAARRKLPYHAAFVAMIALGALMPTTYLSFLWNRVRYVWPFAGAWCVLLGVLAREVGDLVRWIQPRAVFVTPLVTGVMVGALVMRLPGTVKDLAQSARAIEKQQVTLGKWARDTLPADARIGVNDTGAIAYFGGRRTFDVVGLTTEGEARYWVAGAGSRFEHYEKLPRERLPTHFIVYPGWMACAPVLGKKLHEATVKDQSILGGVTMVAHEARWDVLGSGASPAAPPRGLTLIDELDVADLESEAAHRYDRTYTWDADSQVKQHLVGAARVTDGGRMNRVRDRFLIKVGSGQPARLMMRVWAAVAVDLVIEAAGGQAGVVRLPGDSTFTEASVALPAGLTGEVPITVTVRPVGPADKARFGSFHYWVYGL